MKTPPAAPHQRIGIMGGSFNPPHEGHRIVAVTALRRLKLDRLWWVVTPGNPLKSTRGLASLGERMDACRALAKDPRMAVTGFESALSSPYTAQTLEFLRLRNPHTCFVWVMGADNLASFHRWQRWRQIARTIPMAVVDRPGWRLKALASPTAHAFCSRRLPEALAAQLATATPPAWVYLTTRLSLLSSSDIRAK